MVSWGHGRCIPFKTNINKIRRHRILKESSPVNTNGDEKEGEGNEQDAWKFSEEHVVEELQDEELVLGEVLCSRELDFNRTLCCTILEILIRVTHRNFAVS